MGIVLVAVDFMLTKSIEVLLLNKLFEKKHSGFNIVLLRRHKVCGYTYWVGDNNRILIISTFLLRKHNSNFCIIYKSRKVLFYFLHICVTF